ncbi:ABC transporter permease [Bdellovibrio bacteriovorus]|uniref:ABC transporter permease n=1 Tax=Bdellovibrio bacteriovorus TaxID=959 RepID=UPI003AA88AC9
MKSFQLAYLNLTRRPVPSCLAIAAIAISVACAGMLLRLNNLAESRFSTLGKGGDAIIGAKSGGTDILLGALHAEGEYPGYLPLKLFESLRQEQTVRFEDGAQIKPSVIKSVIPFLYFAKWGDVRVVATDESFVSRPRAEDSPKLKEGRWATGINEAVVGYLLAQKHGLKVGDQFDGKLWLGPKVFASSSVKLKVVGVFDSTHSIWDRLVFTDLSTAQNAMKILNMTEASIWGPGVLNYFLVYLNPQGFDSLANLVNNRTVGQAVDVPVEIKKLNELVGAGQELGIFVTILILVLGGLSMAAMLITRFEAMSLQLAVLRAMGYRKSSIGGWLLWEGFLLGLAAVFFGLVMDVAGFPALRLMLGTSLPGPDIVASSIFESAPVWVTAIVATTASVFVPLYRVYHQDVHFSLRN